MYVVGQGWSWGQSLYIKYVRLIIINTHDHSELRGQQQEGHSYMTK